MICAVNDLLRIADYKSFESTILQSVGDDSSTNQLAIFYRLTKEIFVATSESENSQKLLSWAKTYYRLKLAPWVVNNNGLVSSTLCEIFNNPGFDIVRHKRRHGSWQ